MSLSSSGLGGGTRAALAPDVAVDLLVNSRRVGRNKISLVAPGGPPEVTDSEAGLTPASSLPDGPLAGSLLSPIAESYHHGPPVGQTCGAPNLGASGEGLAETPTVSRTCGEGALFRCDVCSTWLCRRHVVSTVDYVSESQHRHTRCRLCPLTHGSAVSPSVVSAITASPTLVLSVVDQCREFASLELERQFNDI